MALPNLREHTNAVKTALEGLGVTVGDAQAPTGNPPHVALYRIVTVLSGPLGAQHDDGVFVYQPTCTGVSREQAEWLVDKVKEILGGVTIAGRYVAYVKADPIPETRRDDTTGIPRWYVTPRFRIFTTPS